MTKIQFSDYQEIMKPFFQLLSGIVEIIEEQKTDQTKEKTADLINQILLSVVIMHVSQTKQGKDIPNSDEIQTQISQGNTEQLFNSFFEGITQDALTKYLSESTTIVMTNYYFEVKDKVTPEKSAQIEKLYQNLDAGV